MADFFVSWLIEGGLGPAVVALPVNWTAGTLAASGKRWFSRFRQTDDLSRIVKAATGTTVDLTDREFGNVRRLLEDQQTWTVVGHGTVNDLTDRIASCLQPRKGRSAADSRNAALVIARGLLEFTVADLDPKLFQRVLLARLQRMETLQASTLDEALFRLHADLAALIDKQEAIQEDLFVRVMRRLDQALEQLPARTAERGEIAVYLRALIDWLNTDHWPQDQRFQGPVLTPEMVEQKLRVNSATLAVGPDVDADDLARRCQRLVVLGGPGSGKTWLAKRTARRCAEATLNALVRGMAPDEVELPLYTTCSRLLLADGDIRYAAVSSALNQVGDMGGSRIIAALLRLFTERSAPTLLVIDSLDEAHGSEERLLQADTLPWRILLTSRPAWWNRQFVMDRGSDSYQVVMLQPLRYPEDVDRFVHRWFIQQPERGGYLVTQIASSRSLRQAVTVPLILTFYCIVGSTDEHLPEFRHDLHRKVLNRILTGRWRGGGIGEDGRYRVSECLETLRAWAWSGAISHSFSGVGIWADDIPTEYGAFSEAHRDAVDHVASPVGLPDVDTGRTLRRFVHRSIREHLVAEQVASLPVDEAAETLLPHIWYDSDWEFVIPAALAMHPQRDQLLRTMMCRATLSDKVPEDASVVDAGWEFRELLARVASESSEDDWSPAIREVIAKARVDLARSARIGNLGGALHWSTSSRQAREVLLGLLAGQTDGGHASELADEVAELGPSAVDKRRAREVLLKFLTSPTVGARAQWLARSFVKLDPTVQEVRAAREMVLALLARNTGDSTVVAQLARGATQLTRTADDKRLLRQALLDLIAGCANGTVVMELANAVSELDPTAVDKRHLREILLGLLARHTQYLDAHLLARVLAQLDPSPQEKRQAREMLLKLLGSPAGQDPARLATAVGRLDATAQDKRQARDVLLGLLAREADIENALWLAEGLAQLDPTAEDKLQARQVLLGLLAGKTAAGEEEEWWMGLAERLKYLDPTAENKRQVREVLLDLLADPSDYINAGHIAWELAGLDPTAEEKREAREMLRDYLADNIDDFEAAGMARAMAELEPTPEDKRKVREVLLRLLAGITDSQYADQFSSELAKFDPAVVDLTTCDAWAVQPTGRLLAAVRRNSPLDVWFLALPLFH